MKEACNSCKFYRTDAALQGQGGLCHYAPPVAYVSQGADGRPQIMPVLPPVPADGFCAHHTPALAVQR